jgi:predicted hotdog family 3-hydroxylacyl-ACP dehydratase
MELDRRWIASRIPHAGKMCLLDCVLSWDATRIECRASSHRDADNPLRAHGRLGCACGVEYAAQAMAVHATLAPPAAVRGAGYLIVLRSTVLHVARLDDIRSDLLVSAARINGDKTAFVYEFELRDAGRTCLNGRATVLLDPNLSRATVQSSQ